MNLNFYAGSYHGFPDRTCLKSYIETQLTLLMEAAVVDPDHDRYRTFIHNQIKKTTDKKLAYDLIFRHNQLNLESMPDFAEYAKRRRNALDNVAQWIESMKCSMSHAIKNRSTVPEVAMPSAHEIVLDLQTKLANLYCEMAFLATDQLLVMEALKMQERAREGEEERDSERDVGNAGEGEPEMEDESDTDYPEPLSPQTLADSPPSTE